MTQPASDMITCSRADFEKIVQEAAATRAGLSGYVSKQPTGYFSTVRVDFAKTGTAPNFTFTAAPGDRIAFGYGIDQPMTTAGYRAGVNASLRNTNLSDAGKTRSGERYYIKGLSLCPSADSDPYLMTLVWSQAFCKLTMNSGGNVWQLGPLFFFPAVAGIFGNGTSVLGAVIPPLAAASTPYSIPENSSDRESADGDPPSFLFNPPLVWRPQGNTDSDLKFPITLPAAIATTAVDRGAAAGIQAFTTPADGAVGTYVDITVRAVGFAEADMSQNA